jgi:hypothetical protein
MQESILVSLNLDIGRIAAGAWFARFGEATVYQKRWHPTRSVFPNQHGSDV